MPIKCKHRCKLVVGLKCMLSVLPLCGSCLGLSEVIWQPIYLYIEYSRGFKMVRTGKISALLYF